MLCLKAHNTQTHTNPLAFFPFGIGSGDVVGPVEIGASTDVLQMNIPFIYYQMEQTELYVSVILRKLVIQN